MHITLKVKRGDYSALETVAVRCKKREVVNSSWLLFTKLKFSQDVHLSETQKLPAGLTLEYLFYDPLTYNFCILSAEKRPMLSYQDTLIEGGTGLSKETQRIIDLLSRK